MKTLLVLLLLAVICKGSHLSVRELIDLLRAQEAVETKRHGFTEPKRHEFTAEAKRHGYTEAKRHGYTAPPVKRHGLPTQAKRQEFGFDAQNHDQTNAGPGKAYIHDATEDEYSGYEEAFLFPGSHYLINMIRMHCESGMGLKIPVSDIKDDFEVPECDMKNMGDVFNMLTRLDDSDGVAILITRMMVKPMLKERMRCPATILDMGFVRLLLSKREQFMAEDETSLYNFFKNMAPLVHPALESLADDIAKAAVFEVHGAIFNETVEFLWKYGLKDLAYASHGIYHELQSYFRSVGAGNGMDLKMGVEAVMSGIECPSSSEVVEYHKREMERFKDVFSTIETEQICLKVAGFLTKYMSHALPEYQLNLDDNSPVTIVCDKIKSVIMEIVQDYAEYESFLFSMNIEEYENMMANVLTNEEWRVLEEALRRLNFIEKF